MSPPITIQALTLDLDDTLWPIWPTIARAEARLLEWLQVRAPLTAAAHDPRSMRQLNAVVARERPDWAHDFSAVRRESIRRALLLSGEDPALAEPAFEVFFAERQRVELFDDVLPALDRLAARWPLVALSNGNADLQRVGLSHYFAAAVSAREFGMAKPAAPIFHAACARVSAAPAAVLHIGDDPAMDVDGALAAGLRAAWVQRPGMHADLGPSATPHHHVRHMLQLADELGC
jgi:FMN hydrolase / 5-amino-6-(5-phospho-D-ribitylamino)uracil phosphatase